MQTGEASSVSGAGGTNTLAEIKVLNAGASRYPRGREQGHQKAVNRRARALPAEYEGKLSKMDRQLHHTEPGGIGPLVRRFRSFPELQGLVVGAFGEASADLHSLVSHLDLSRGNYVAQSSGYATSEREHSQIIGQLRRKLSTAFIRATGLCTLSRIANVGAGSRSAAKRREWAIREDEGMKRERRAH